MTGSFAFRVLVAVFLASAGIGAVSVDLGDRKKPAVPAQNEHPGPVDNDPEKKPVPSLEEAVAAGVYYLMEQHAKNVKLIGGADVTALALLALTANADVNPETLEKIAARQGQLLERRIREQMKKLAGEDYGERSRAAQVGNEFRHRPLAHVKEALLEDALAAVEKALETEKDDKIRQSLRDAADTIKERKKEKKTLSVPAFIEAGRNFLLQADSAEITRSVVKGSINHWAAPLALLALLPHYREKPTPEAKTQIQKLVLAVEKDQRGTGGWGYFKGHTMSFLTAPCLIALLEAKHAGFEVSPQKLDKGIKRLKSFRKIQGNFSYAAGAGQTDGWIGSCARNAPCELALFLAGESSQEKLQLAVSSFFCGRHELEKAREKGGGHGAGMEGIAAYYYFFGHFWAAQALHFVDKNARIETKKHGNLGRIAPDPKLKPPGPDARTPAECLATIRAALLAIQGDGGGRPKRTYDDGRWVDPGVRSHATAMALVALSGKKVLAGTK